MMLTMIVNIYTRRFTDQAKVEAPVYSSTVYCLPNTKEEDKKMFLST